MTEVSAKCESRCSFSLSLPLSLSLSLCLSPSIYLSLSISLWKFTQSKGKWVPSSAACGPHVWLGLNIHARSELQATFTDFRWSASAPWHRQRLRIDRLQMYFFAFSKKTRPMAECKKDSSEVLIAGLSSVLFKIYFINPLTTLNTTWSFNISINEIWDFIIKSEKKEIDDVPVWRIAPDWGRRWCSTNADSCRWAACKSTDPFRPAAPTNVVLVRGTTYSTNVRRQKRRTRRKIRVSIIKHNTHINIKQGFCMDC